MPGPNLPSTQGEYNRQHDVLMDYQRQREQQRQQQSLLTPEQQNAQRANAAEQRRRASAWATRNLAPRSTNQEGQPNGGRKTRKTKRTKKIINKKKYKRRRYTNRK